MIIVLRDTCPIPLDIGGGEAYGDAMTYRRDHAMPTWDILERSCAYGDDAVTMSKGCHYNYRHQKWEDGHDHAHYCHDRGALMFCGADLASCHTHPDGSAHDGDADDVIEHARAWAGSY